MSHSALTETPAELQQLLDLTIMKLLQDSEDAKAERKSLKPQVERRRRERMNRSLESLKTLLLQQQEASQRRVEKAEILEHTVLFLQNTAARNRMRAEGGGGEKHSFQDGFSTCLQRAARFLGPEGKGLWLGAALDASLAGAQRKTDARSSSSSSSSSSGSLLLSKSSRSILRLLIQRSGHRLSTLALATVPTRAQTRGGSATATSTSTSTSSSTSTPLQPRKVASRASKQSQPVSQPMWRPWP